MTTKYTKQQYNIFNGHKIYQMTIPKIYLFIHFPFQGPPKYNKLGIFGMQAFHLTTLVGKDTCQPS
jgi:hypothetical protein